MIAESRVPCSTGDIQPIAGREKLPLAVNQRDKCRGDPEEAGGEGSKTVECVFRKRARLLIRCQRRKAGGLMV